MYYELLRSLYLGEGTNADLTSPEARRRLHVATDLDRFVPAQVDEGRSVVLTGNPGDGKSHLVRLLSERKRLDRARIILDLSAMPEKEAAETWREARRTTTPLVLCANEGPLLSLLNHMESDATLSDLVGELRSQLGRLTSPRLELLAPDPQKVVLVDLGERNLLDEGLISKALKLVTQDEFVPPGAFEALDTDAGRNILLFQQVPYAAKRLARVLALAAQREGEHVSFRSLWSGISWALTRGRQPTVCSEVGSNPLDYLIRRSRPQAQGLLPAAVSRHADPARCPLPELDEALWTLGRPSFGSWHQEAYVPTERPAALWNQGREEAALDLFDSLKRAFVLAHSEGERLLEAMASQELDFPSRLEDGPLLEQTLAGLRRLYLPREAEPGAPTWLLEGLPLWTNLTYEEVPVHERPHVAVAALPFQDFELLRPRRVPWLKEVLGPLPEVVWLSHRPSSIALRLSPQLLATLRQARQSSGPSSPPEPIQRFLSRLSGWEEAQHAQDPAASPAGRAAILQRPRGALLTAVTISHAGEGYAYGPA